jgi:hypothetical protein
VEATPPSFDVFSVATMSLSVTKRDAFTPSKHDRGDNDSQLMAIETPSTGTIRNSTSASAMSTGAGKTEQIETQIAISSISVRASEARTDPKETL